MKQTRDALCWLALCPLLAVQESAAVTFNTSLLAGASGESDLSRFFEDRNMLAGRQEMDIYVNDDWKGRYNLLFGDDSQHIQIKKSDAALLGLDLSALKTPPFDPDFYTLQQVVQGGSVAVNSGTLSVRLTVPQRFVEHTEAGYVPPRFWNEGVPALLLSWNSTWYKTFARQGGSGGDDNFYTGLESGANLAGWQFRDSSAFRKRSGDGGSWQNNTRFIRKPLAAIKSSLTAGDFYSGGTLFDSIRTRGVSLASDLAMRPNSQQGFSPVVRGVAQTNAMVSVVQNGVTIYQENVPPGQFILDNIQPTGSSGDLLVKVREADGREQIFTVPFSAVPGMLKEGVSQYDLVAGRVKQANTRYEPPFVRGTVRYGFNNLVTGYAGALFSKEYRAGLLGAGWNFPIGALSVDMTHADTRLPYKRQSGQSLRVSYSKFFNTTATNFTLAAYRYSTKGYYSFSDAIYSRDGYSRYRNYRNNFEPRNPDEAAPVDLNTWDALRSARPRNTFTLNLNQRLGDSLGTLFFSGTWRDYWNQQNANREYQLGYSNVWQRLNYAVSASRVRNDQRQEETRLYLTLSVPFSLFDNSAWLSAGISTTRSRYQQSNVTLSGSALESQRLTWTLSGANQQGGQNTASANLAWRSRFSTLSGSYSESGDYRQAGLSARGSVVAIPWHVLASNEMGNTLMVVEAPKAKGLMVNGDSSIVTNGDGLALIPYATPYRKNTITLTNTEAMSGAEVKGNQANSIPYEGSVNVIRFATDTRRSWTFRALDGAGRALPFGAEVVDKKGQTAGYVGQASVLYVKADNAPERLEVLMKNRRCVLVHPPLSLDGPPAQCR
ncbi:fimbria/pilus outer membrane usher protein [Intestinirhabdus alba]|uniref:Fimbria/pilus outer membrane usher protein n=1 Tax=Intestinirhabdus alba TaxID=2899544 RepID=A0A6L6IS27_9ENTR|nr:fimbria/pilus outer membrane usher protein [Intestinirhabdus alba]MTH47820.1 fimbria/pilus outer membrane usher protein [Intestinirhabdus alba]